MQIPITLAGIAVLFALAWLMSADRKAIDKRTVLVAFALQVGIAALIMYVPAGKAVVGAAVKGVGYVIDFGNSGIEFVFGERARDSLGFTIALNVLPEIVFFSALMSILYYLGIMQRVVAILGGGLRRLLRTSQIESMCAVANIFVGHTESPLVVKPYLADMSESELFAMMTVGCATIAGAVMAAYAMMGVNLEYLITASFMAAPGGLMISKMLVPETEHRDIRFDPDNLGDEKKAINIFEAIGNGAATGLVLALNVGAMLLAFVSVIALLNGVLGILGGYIGLEDLSMQFILGKLFAPVAFLIGVPWDEAVRAGALIGEKFIINEFYAYARFVQIKASLSEGTQLIVTFALCGFANLTSIAILMGGLGSIIPDRRRDIARLGLKAVIGGTLVNLMNAAVAGIFFSLQ